MVSLKKISNYVDQTANIIANVLQFDVLIVDKTLQIIGDSDLASVSENECIRTDSILARVIEEKKRVVLNSKDDNKGCQFCTQRNSCLVEMIIGIPIFYQGDILGSVGVIANTLSDRDKMISNQENYLKFVDHMIELIVNKLKEEQDYEVISLLKKRMEVVLDSIDQFLVLVSNNGEILQTNLNFKKVFNRKKPEHLSEFFDAECIKLLLNKSDVKYKEVKIDKKYDFIVSSKPVVLNDQDRGALITFRSLKDIAVEMNELYTHSMDVAFDDLIGKSVQIKEVKERIKQISNSDSTVLIEGETGTGKEVIARLIHNVSSRKDELFVAINCSAIPEDLMESELFGYEDGAFSGARKGGKIGKFHLADGGTIFLDEIGELALHLQAKLLRVLQEKKVTKIGGLESSNVDIRIITATNRKLKELVQEGKFREDLYYRINVIPIKSPPLRERIDDLPLLIDYFIQFYNNRIEKSIIGVSEDALKLMKKYSWRGNVRELRNAIEFAVNMTNSDMITSNSLPYEIRENKGPVVEELNLEIHTMKLIEKALDKYGTTTIGKELAAQALGISVATLYRKMKEYVN